MNSYKYENGKLVVYSNTGVKDYCNQNGINLSDFNEPVIIVGGITDCSGMFRGCETFNKPVFFPDNAVDCSEMFYGCSKFNQPLDVPGGIKNYREIYNEAPPQRMVSNQPVITPDSVTRREEAFLCLAFNQPIHIPRYVYIPESVVNCTNMFNGCKNYRQTTLFPISVTKYIGAFDGCPGDFDEDTRTFTPRLEKDSDPEETSLF